MSYVATTITEHYRNEGLIQKEIKGESKSAEKC